jgi:hypothetical protein
LVPLIDLARSRSISLDLGAQLMPDEHAKCAEFLRHKTTLIAPGVFAQNGVRCSTLRQYAGEFVITLPKVGSPLMALDCACSPSMALDCERTTLL